MSRLANNDYFSGISWITTGGALSAGRQGLSGAGIASDALAIGGTEGAEVAITQRYSANAWSTVGALSAAVRDLAACGLTTDALAVGGYTGAAVVATAQTFNGTAWTGITNSSITRMSAALAGNSSSQAVVFGGYTSGPISSTSTEEWNGSAWTARGNMILGRFEHTSAGSNRAALAVSGRKGTGSDPYPGGYTPTCEKYN